ncbi:hypothetical protein JW930_03070 [Candidatus Woesearchaeota archaeon]|nr:hypothetical protein [Candidatus Woesearchaeota archaeon]
MKKPIVLTLSLIFLLCITGCLYLFVFGSPFSRKPVIEQPKSTTQEVDRITYLMNELGAYKLHKNTITSELPVIEVYVGGNIYNTIVENNVPMTYIGKPEYADLQIVMDTNTLFNITVSENVSEQIVLSLSENRVSINVLCDKKDLLLKGYNGIYANLLKETSLITGKAIEHVDILKFQPMDIFFIILLFTIALIIEHYLS